MKVLHFIASTGIGRGEVYVDLVNELCKNIEIILLVPKNALYKERIDKKIEVIEYSAYDSRKNPLLLIEIFWKIKKLKPDIVHTHFGKASEIFYFINKLLNLPHVATKHNPRKGKIFHKIQNVIAVSQGVRESIPNDKVKVIYNGISPIEVFSQKRDEIFTILAVGRLDKIKGFDILIKECAKLDFPFRLQIIGEGKERKNLEYLIHKLGLEENISLLGFRKDIPQLMKNADMVVMSSHSEGFSLVMVESIFYANLFVSTRVSGATEVLEEKFLFDEFNFSQKLNDIYRNYTIFKENYLILTKKIQNKFLLEHIAKEHILYYQSIINSKTLRN